MNNLSMGKSRGESFDSKPHLVKINIDNYKIWMEVDPDASYSVISWSFYEKYFRNKLLQECRVPLSVSSGTKLNVKGQITVAVQSFRSVRSLSLIVIETRTKCLPLLGRDWLNALLPDWKGRLNINKVTENIEDEFSLDNLKKLFPKVFDEDYTKAIEDYVANIVMEKNSTPVFCGPYTVPYGLRDKVDQEIDRLINCGILEQVSFSNWASPMVVVEKSNGAIRLCMDCKVSIKKNM